MLRRLKRLQYSVKELAEKYRKQAYEELKFYQDICEIRRLIFKITEKFAKKHMRLVSQMRDAARSAKQNVREGYRRGTVGEFIHSIKISQGSLEELSGDMEDCLEDGLISEEEFQTFVKLFRSSTYLSSRYIKSIYKLEENGKWKVPGKSVIGNFRNLR
jgi:four helix bundle protein